MRCSCVPIQSKTSWSQNQVAVRRWTSRAVGSKTTRWPRSSTAETFTFSVRQSFAMISTRLEVENRRGMPSRMSAGASLSQATVLRGSVWQRALSSRTAARFP
jgi:hypothetical protein